jgi:hypothetical protein
MSDIWATGAGQVELAQVCEAAWRMVESQEEIATSTLVDTLAEQAELERLLDSSKLSGRGTKPLHYLLARQGARVEAFTFVSARDPFSGINAALFTPSAFEGFEPREQTAWSCETTPTTVTLRQHATYRVPTYPSRPFWSMDSCRRR